MVQDLQNTNSPERDNPCSKLGRFSYTANQQIYSIYMEVEVASAQACQVFQNKLYILKVRKFFCAVMFVDKKFKGGKRFL